MSELIDRQDALDALCDACTLARVKSECIFKNLESCMDHNAILDVPAVEEQWIPCSERLPEIGQSVLLSVGGMYSAEGCLREDGDWAQFRWNAIQRKDMVGAWRPLPEPYKGEQE
jgi:hypothetical protein